MYDPNVELDTVTRLLGALFANGYQNSELAKAATELAKLLMKQISKQYED